jgi:hypothetical protein
MGGGVQRKTGKTQLLRRLQGLDFVADYTPTPEITTAHLIWTCPATEEKVKVEFWDVVDKGIQPNQTWAGVTGGKGAEAVQAPSEQENIVLLDAETIDVYRGCDGVLLLHDPSRPETLAYSLGLLREMKPDIPAILVANFADSRASVNSKELSAAIKRRERSASISTCAKDGFGVDLVRDFLTVPFLGIKGKYAERQLKSAREAIGVTRNKLDTFGDTLNFAAHCQQWSAGGAAMAAQQAARMQAARKEAAGVSSSPDPDTPKAKMVPIEKLLLPPRVDEQAPDLGKEVATFNTGSIDENFFSSDDEMASEVQVMTLDDDDEEEVGGALAAAEGDSDDAEQPAASGAGAGGTAGGARKEAKRSSDEESSEEEDEEVVDRGEVDAAEGQRLEALARQAAEQKAAAERLEAMRLEALHKASAEEERLKNELQTMDVGALDADFLDSDAEQDDAAEEEEEKAEAAAGKVKRAKKKKGSDSSDTSDSSDSDGYGPLCVGRPSSLRDRAA